MTYKPYRILKPFVTIVEDVDDVRACYPHGKRGERMIETGTVGIAFSEGVIDAPTEEEIALFSLPALSGSVKPIPQDGRGFDLRLSGVARSVEGSKRGHAAGIIEKHERDSAKAQRELDKKTEPKVEAEPEPAVTASEDSLALIKNLEYLGPMAIKSLADKNVLRIADLGAWTAEALDDLRGIGAILAERLLAEYETYQESLVINETKDGDKE